MGLFSLFGSKKNNSKSEINQSVNELSEDQELYNMGLKYRKNNDIKNALDCFISAAKLGNDRAQYDLGYMYSCGIGVECNHEIAIKYFQLAADQGRVHAYGNLAYHFLNGLGGARDEEKGIKYLIKAAEGGDVGSQCNLGGLYLDENCSHLETDVNKAIKWLKLAASNNEHPASYDAQFKLGNICYLFSYDGLKESEVIKAKEWWSLAAQNGHEGAKQSLEKFCYGMPYNEFEPDDLYHETEEQAGKSDIVANITQGVNSRISSERVALQFVLEELDSARQGNEAAVQFVKNSGFSPSEYEGALQNSFEEVDGPDGPQVFLLLSVKQFSSDMDFMVSLRVKVVEKIIHDWGLNRQGKGRTDNLLQSLRNILEDDDSVMPALTKNIPVPASARTRHVNFSQTNIDSAQKIVSTLTEITGDDVDSIIKNALQITSHQDDEISQFDDDIPF